MAEVHKKGLNAELIMNDLANCCRSADVCGKCQQAACSIGYARQCVENYQKEPKKEVPNGTENLPTSDYKAFDELELEIAIAHVLKECKDCKEDHVEDCIINVIRNCYEIGLLGDAQPYEGSSIQYLMHLQSAFPDKAVQIADAYKQ